MLKVVCLEAGNYQRRGLDYTRNLYQAVARNLSLPHRFTIFTDAYDTSYSSRDFAMYHLPHDGLRGWMNKLALFKPGVFETGERILYIDLDTLITGPLDDIAAYAGNFAMLEDLTQPTHLGSGLMSWVAGYDTTGIWFEYVKAGYPDVPGGDQVWIENWAREYSVRVDRWQDLYPNQVHSYKVSGGVLNPHARVVCFHGRPRPHEVTQGWVPRIWEG